MSLAHHHQAHIVFRSANQKPGELLISQSEARKVTIARPTLMMKLVLTPTQLKHF